MNEIKIDQILAAFSRGHIQDALNIMSLMDEHGIIRQDIIDFLNTPLIPSGVIQRAAKKGVKVGRAVP